MIIMIQVKHTLGIFHLYQFQENLSGKYLANLNNLYNLAISLYSICEAKDVFNGYSHIT